MKLNQREMLLALVTLTVVAAAFVLLPLASHWSTRQAQIKTLRAKVLEGRQLIKREDGIRSHWSEMQTNALAPNTSVAEQQFLKALDGWSRDAGAEVTSIMPQWKSDAKEYQTLACRVEAAGDLGSLSKLLYAVEKGPLAVKLDSIELTARDGTGQLMTLGLELNGLSLSANNQK